MPLGQRRNDEMVGLLGADLLTLRDRNIYFSAYDSQTQNFNDGSVQTLGYDTVHLTTSADAFTLSSDVLTVNYNGIFWFEHQISVKQNAFTSNVLFSAWLERNSGSGFGELLGSRMRVATHSSEYTTGSVCLLTRVLSGYQFRVRAQRLFGNDTCTVSSNERGMRWVCLVGL